MKKQDQVRDAFMREIQGYQAYMDKVNYRSLTPEIDGLLRPNNLYFVSGRLTDITPERLFWDLKFDSWTPCSNDLVPAVLCREKTSSLPFPYAAAGQRLESDLFLFTGT